jgi:hypothetical protein
MGGVTLDLLHRIRWANVARAAAVALALLLVLAWPRLRAHSDALPPAVEPAPAVATKAPRVERPVRVVEAKAPPAETVVPKRRVAQRRGVRRHRHARHRRPRPPRIVIRAATPAPAYVAAPAAAAVTAAEFRP